MSIFSYHDGVLGSLELGALVTASEMRSNTEACWPLGDAEKSSSVSSPKDADKSTPVGEENVCSDDELRNDPSLPWSDAESGISRTV
jgi:hypothetical protein